MKFILVYNFNGNFLKLILIKFLCKFVKTQKMSVCSCEHEKKWQYCYCDVEDVHKELEEGDSRKFVLLCIHPKCSFMLLIIIIRNFATPKVPRTCSFYCSLDKICLLPCCSLINWFCFLLHSSLSPQFKI